MVEAVDRQRRPALRLAAAVWEHVVYHGIHRRAAFVTDSEIRALTEEPRRALIAKRDSYQEMFGGMIRDGVEDGSLRSPTPPSPPTRSCSSAPGSRSGSTPPGR